jgi:uncharacterized protein
MRQSVAGTGDGGFHRGRHAVRDIMPTMNTSCHIAVSVALALLTFGSVLPAQTRPGAKPTASHPAQSRPATQPAVEHLTIAGEQFELEVAATPEARERGLMHRDRIEERGGMLFIYPEPQILSFWMKNCPIEMDILFVDDEGIVVATHRMKPAPPRLPDEMETAYDDRLPRYESRKPAQFAIELQAGTISLLKIKPGLRLEMDLKRLESLTSTLGPH